MTPVFGEVEDVARMLEPGAPRFTTVGPGGSPQPTPAFYTTMNSRLLVFDGLEATVAGRTLAPLRRLRLDFESAAVGAEPGWEGSFAKVFELVPGARIGGRARPGEPVELRLDLVTDRGRRLTYRDRADADAGGAFKFTVPYATAGAATAVRAAGPYRITAAGRAAEATVTEAEIAAGRPVAVELAAAARR